MNPEDALSTEAAIAAIADFDDDAPLAEDFVQDDDEADDDVQEDDDEIDAEDEVHSDADEDDDDPDADPDVDEEEDDDESDEDPTIEAPQFLDEKEREAFAALPRAAQEMVLKHDKMMTADYTRKTQIVAEERKAVQAQRKQLDDTVSRIGDVVSEAETKAQAWSKVDWVKLAQNVTAEEYNQFEAQARQDIQALQEHRKKHAEAETTQLKVHVETERAKLQEIAPTQAPEFLQPDAPEKVIKPLFDYIRENEYSEDEIRYIGARDMIIAYKAMRYDALVKASKERKGKKGDKTSALTPKPDARTRAKPVRGGASASSSKRTRTDRTLQKEFRRTGNSKLAMKLLEDFD